MIKPEKFYKILKSKGIDFYAGVPDSLLSNFCAYVEHKSEKSKHVIAANEGNAIGVALGYYISTGRPAAVYMQNSGLGNAINPLVSLAVKEIYSVPIFLIIGWRGEVGVVDEPQHIVQGKITLDQLELLGIPYWIVDSNENIEEVVEKANRVMLKEQRPVALVFRKNTFEAYEEMGKDVHSELNREAAIEELIDCFGESPLYFATTGKTARELYEIRKRKNQNVSDFLIVGGMGHTSSIAFGAAIGQPNRRIICLDGDGSMLMHLGALPVIAEKEPQNFIHVLLNNRAHDSVGGQPTAAHIINFEKLSDALGYRSYFESSNMNSLKIEGNKILNTPGPIFFELKIGIGSRNNLGRPLETPLENRDAFMKKAGVI